MKKLNKKGFTMAELLIVVAIIAVLVAIAIPIFTSQLEKSREGTDLANIRAAYAECSASALDGDAGFYKEVNINQKTKGWEGNNSSVKIADKVVSSLTADFSTTVPSKVYVTVTSDGVFDVVTTEPTTGSGFTKLNQ